MRVMDGSHDEGEEWIEHKLAFRAWLLVIDYQLHIT